MQKKLCLTNAQQRETAAQLNGLSKHCSALTDKGSHLYLLYVVRPRATLHWLTNPRPEDVPAINTPVVIIGHVPGVIDMLYSQAA